MLVCLICCHSGCAPENEESGRAFSHLNGEQLVACARVHIRAVEVMVIPLLHPACGVPLGQVAGMIEGQTRDQVDMSGEKKFCARGENFERYGLLLRQVDSPLKHRPGGHRAYRTSDPPSNCAGPVRPPGDA